MSKGEGKLKLDFARDQAERLVKVLAPYCTDIAVAGSIRRQVARVNDIDLLIMPDPPQAWELYSVLNQLGARPSTDKKVMRFHYYGTPVDLYIAGPDNWATLLLIRTGSAEHNRRLCQLALEKNMRLHADGRGLFKIEVQGCEGQEVRIAGDTEESIFEALGISYKRPEERICG